MSEERKRISKNQELEQRPENKQYKHVKVIFSQFDEDRTNKAYSLDFRDTSGFVK